MRDYDPWIFGMLWEMERREELGQAARARLAREAAAWRTAQPLLVSARPGLSSFGQALSNLTSGVWLRLRRLAV